MLNKNDHDSSNVLYDEDFEANDENIFNWWLKLNNAN